MSTREEHATERAYSRAFELYMKNTEINQLGPAIQQARAALDLLTQKAVEQAVRQGHSWTAIGNGLGVTRQAAKQKYGHLRP